MENTWPYVIFYVLLCGVGGWTFPVAWVIPLIIVIIPLIRSLKGLAFEIREISIHQSDVLIRYTKYDSECSYRASSSDLSVKMKRDSTLYRRYLIEFKGPNLSVRQYEWGAWKKNQMISVLLELQAAGVRVSNSTDEKL